METIGGVSYKLDLVAKRSQGGDRLGATPVVYDDVAQRRVILLEGVDALFNQHGGLEVDRDDGDFFVQLGRPRLSPR